MEALARRLRVDISRHSEGHVQLCHHTIFWAITEMLAMVSVCLSAAFPRIVPLRSSQAIGVISAWHDKCQDTKRQELIRQVQCECRAESRVLQRGTIGLIRAGECTVIATFVTPPLTLTDLLSDDEYSGTLLMKAIVKTASIQTADTLEDRWKLAAPWFKY